MDGWMKTFDNHNANIVHSKIIIVGISTTCIHNLANYTYILNQLSSTWFHKQQSLDLSPNTCIHTRPTLHNIWFEHTDNDKIIKWHHPIMN
jgi:hypothetical protein